MFWGLIMESGKRYTQTVERAFHVSMACLEPNTADNENVSVMLAFDSGEFILCNLNKHKAIQTQLDLNFQSGDKIAFMSSGKGRVHLTGYLLETDEDDDEDEEEDDVMIDDSMDIESMSKKQTNDLNKGSGKRKNEPQLSKSENKKPKLAEPETDEDDDDDVDEDDDDDDLEEMLGDSSEDEDEEDDDEDEEDDDEDDDEDESEDEVQTSPKQTPQSQKKGKKMKTPNQTPQQKLNEKQKTPNEKQKTPNEKQKTPNEKQKMKNLLEQQQNKKTPNEKQQQQQKNKTPGEKHQGNTPKQSPGSQMNGIPQQQSGKKNKNKDKGLDTSKGGKSPGGDSPQKKVLEGGVQIEEIRVGNGPIAKPGRQVAVYYVGRLKHNNKQFDSTTEGSGFKFRLGRGEVIKGWDIGVSGMKVGGKRKIVCPAFMAYGNRGSPPAIPPNSNLVFEVELKAVN